MLATALTSTAPAAYYRYIEQATMSDMVAYASPMPRIPPTINWGSGKAEVSAQEMISGLRQSGLPISAIAEAMRVERKSVYSWLSGSDMRSANTQRAAQIHRLFISTVPGVDARSLYRFWNTPVRGTKTLRDLIVAEVIDEKETTSALGRLRPAALRAMDTERKMARHGTANPAIDELPEAGANT